MSHDIHNALNAIDPSIERADWVRVGMALKSEFGDAGFELFDRWSQGGHQYRSADCRSTWKSLSPTGGITARTLYFLARAAGWRG